MKRALKSVLLASLMVIMLLALTGCGNKLVATKETEDSTMGKYKEEIEVSYKGDKVNSVKMTYEFDNEDKAKGMKALFDLGVSGADEDVGYKVEQKGKKLIMTFDAKAYEEMTDGDEEANMTKEELKKSLEEDGYKVK